jgi:hypothetical protein
MDPIREVIRRAGRRLLLASWLRLGVILLTAAVTLAVIGRAVEKLAPAVTLDWAVALPVLVAVAVLGALLGAWIRRPRDIDIARTVDEKAGLRETLSTAMCVDQDAGPWSRAVVDDAGQKARRVIVKDAVPIEAPGNSWWPVAACAVLLAVWWLPAYDLAGLMGREVQSEDDRARVQQVAESVSQTEQEIQGILARAGIDMDQDAPEGEDLFDPAKRDNLSPEEMQRAAMKKLTNLSDQLEERLNSEEAMTFDAIREAMERMKQPGPGPMAEMARAMSQGDFAEANRQLAELAAKIESGEMSDEQKAQMQSQLAEMSEILKELAENREALEKMLEQAGMSAAQAAQMAADPEALENALKEMGLSQQQIESLKQQAEANQGMCDAASAMSQAMGKMSEAMPSGASSELAECAGELSGQLSALEMMQMEKMSLQAALGECKNGMVALSKNSWGKKPGVGPGIGSGGIAREFGEGSDTPEIDFQVESLKGVTEPRGQGPVIASTLVYGTQVRGESRAQFTDAVRSAEAEATEAIETRRVPREHVEAVKAYFGRLQKNNPAQDGAAAPASPTPAPD